MQTGSDLVSAGFPTSNPLITLFGGLSNVTQPNVPPRSNIEWGAILGGASDAAIAASGVGLAVAVPALPGMTVSRVGVFAGATAEASGTNGFLALYSGTATPTLLAQTAAITGAAAIAASAAYTGMLTAAVTLTAATAPYGFVYAAISLTATTMPTLISFAPPAAIQYALGVGAPAFLAASFGSALGGTAPATISGATRVAQAPLVVLT